MPAFLEALDRTEDVRLEKKNCKRLYIEKKMEY